MTLPTCSPADHWELVADCTGLDSCVLDAVTVGVTYAEEEEVAATASQEVSDIYRC